MILVLNNIREFSCSYNNICREVEIHFSNFLGIFIFEALNIILEIPLRYELLADLIKRLSNNNSILPHLIYGLILFKQKYQNNFIINICSFIEFLKCKAILSKDEYKIVLNFIGIVMSDEYKEYIELDKEKIIKVATKAVSKSEISEEKVVDIEKPEKIDNMRIQLVKKEMYELTTGDKTNRYSSDMKLISILLYNSGKVSFNIFRQIFCLPCERQIQDYEKPFLDIINYSLFDVSQMQTLLKIYNVHFDDMIDCNIAVDAAVFNSVKGSKIKETYSFLADILEDDIEYNSIFTYLIEPFDPGIRSFPIHVELKSNGFADEKIDGIRTCLIDDLFQCNINCMFTSTDGDKYFDDIHENAFNEYKHLVETGKSFDEIIQVVRNHDHTNPWPISDPFHSLKNIREKSLFREIGISIIQRFDQKELELFIEKKKCLFDNSSQATMKDSYPLELFGFESFLESIPYNQSHFFICPFFFYIESIRNYRLNKETRKKYLHAAFIFINYYLHLIGYIRTIGTRIALIRLMNTILGIYLIAERDSFNAANIGTHPVECFYGTVRIGCHFQHTIFNVVQTISKTVLSNCIMDEFDIHKKIYGRKNVGGAKVEPREDSYGYFPFSPDEFFIIYLKKLYGLKIDETTIQKLDNWYNYLKENHHSTDDCENYIQGSLAGCNIMSRNAVGSRTKVNYSKQRKTETTIPI